MNRYHIERLRLGIWDRLPLPAMPIGEATRMLEMLHDEQPYFEPLRIVHEN